MESIEKQYQKFFLEYSERGPVTLGPLYSAVWRSDPKKLVITLSRYKFVAKMLRNKSKVLEIGCAEGWAASLVSGEVGELTLSDMDTIWEQSISDVHQGKVKFKELDFVSKCADQKYDAIYALDVLEHVLPINARTFCENLIKSLTEDGVAILGMPSIESQVYASEASKEGHVNCMSGEAFRELMNNYFKNVFLFSMNDEVVHTGFSQMAHYLIVLCVGPKVSQ